MDRKILFGGLSAFSFIAILFTSPDSNIWIYFLILGIIFAIGWLKN